MKISKPIFAIALLVFCISSTKSAFADWDQLFSGVHCKTTNKDGLDPWTPTGDILMGNKPVYAVCPVSTINGISSSDFEIRNGYLHATEVVDARLCRRDPNGIDAGNISCGTSNQVGDSWYLYPPAGSATAFSRYYINVNFNKGATPALIFEYRVNWHEI